MSHRFIKSTLTVGCAALILVACKKKEAPAVIEEAPQAMATDTDTTSTLSEEPDLQHVGGKAGEKQGKGGSNAVFHPSAAATAAGFSDVGRYVVQVSIFKSKRQAANLVEKLANAGFPAYVAEVENPTPDLTGTWHRVRVGNFKTVSDAKAFGENTLAGMGYQFWVDNKKNDAVGGEGSYSAPASEPAYEPKDTYQPATPSEPATPSSETWGTPANEEPATPSGETWGTPATTETPAYDPTESSPTTPTDNSSSSMPTENSPADTGKVNLDEW